MEAKEREKEGRRVRERGGEGRRGMEETGKRGKKFVKRK